MSKAAFILGFLCSFVGAWAADYYVATTGNNGNPGSQGSPWLTLTYALTQAAAGDTIYLVDGAYHELAATTASGTAGNPITIRGTGASKPRLAAIDIDHNYISIYNIEFYGHGGQASMVFVYRTCDNVIIEDCDFDPQAPATGRSQLVVDYNRPPNQTNPSNVTIRGCNFLNNEYYCIALSGTDHLVENCYFGTPTPNSGNAGDAIYLHSSNTTIRGNIWEDFNQPDPTAHTDCIQAFSSNGEIAKNNIIEQNLFTGGFGLQIGNLEDQALTDNIDNWTWRNNLWVNVPAKMSIYVPNQKFHNNLFYKSGTNSGGPLLFRNSPASKGVANGGECYNNIFVECGSTPSNPIQGFYSVEGGLTFTADYNLVTGPAGNRTKTLSEANAVNGQDPLFTDELNEVFTLQSGSPARGAGTNLSGTFTNDYTGNTRSAWDIGPYEYAASVLRHLNTGTVTIGP